MKIGFLGWFGLIIGVLGLGFGLVAVINPMAIGSLMFQPGADQVMPYITFGLPVVIIVAALGPLAVSAINNHLKKKRLQQVGIKGSAKILKVEDTGVTVNMDPYVKITVLMPNGNNATFKMLISRVEIPRPGDVIEVLYDPSDQTVVMAA